MRYWFIVFGACFVGLIASCATSKPPKEFAYRQEPTPVRITELHFDPSDEQGKVEFVEVANITKKSADISGWQITGAGRVTLPAGTVLEPGEAIVLCADKAAFAATFGRGVRPVAELTGKLKNKGETVRIEDSEAAVADEAGYDESDPVVEEAAGTGLSLHRARLRATATQGMWRAAKPSPGSVKLKTK